MTDISDLVSPERVLVGVRAASKAQLLAQLARLAAQATGLGADVILDWLSRREGLGTTGVGGGIAIPHAKVPGLERLTSFFVKLAQGIDFAAVDGLPVDLVFLVLAPETAGAEHLKALARLARVL